MQISHMSVLKPEGPFSALYRVWNTLTPNKVTPMQTLLIVPTKTNRSKVNPVLGNAKWVFSKINQIMGITNVDPSTPLWGNTKLGSVAELKPPQCWIDKGVCTIADVWRQDKPLTFSEIKERWAIPSSHWLF